jgi:hypothetical protein
MEALREQGHIIVTSVSAEGIARLEQGDYHAFLGPRGWYFEQEDLPILKNVVTLIRKRCYGVERSKPRAPKRKKAGHQ